MTIMVGKLVTGDEIVGDFTEGGLQWDISKPRVFQVMQDPGNGSIRAGLMPLMLSCPEATVVITVDKFLVDPLPAPIDLEKSYRQQTSVLDLSGVV